MTASNFSRRKVLRVAGGSAAVLTVPRFGLAQANAPIKLGSLLPRLEPFALQGEATTLGLKIALEQANYTVFGRKIEWVAYDEPNPLGAQQNMQKLVQEDKVAAVIGGSNSATGLANASVATQAKMPTIISAALAKEITGKNCNHYVFRHNATPIVHARRLARQMLSLGKRCHFQVDNYAYGHQACVMLKAELLAAGGKDTGMDVASVGTTDFSSVILKIRLAKPDVIALGIAGTDLASFLKQFDEFGLCGKIPVGSLTIADEENWAQPNPGGIMGKYWHFNNPQNSVQDRAFSFAVTKAIGHSPSQSCAQGWVCTRTILAAIEKEKSAEPEAIVRGLETVRPDGLPGYFRDWDHKFITCIVVTQVKDSVTDKFDALRIINKPMTLAKYEPIYGTKEDVGCTLGSI